MQCELCGKNTELLTAVVEGTQLKVCNDCGSFGKIIARPQPVQERKKPVQARQQVVVEKIVSDYARLIRSEREKRGMTQEDFAKLIGIKASLVHKLETGNIEPQVEIARKLEKKLGITLVETTREKINAVTTSKKRAEGLTIGDIINLKH